MSAHTRVVLFICMMALATGSVVVFNQVHSGASDSSVLGQAASSTSLTDAYIAHVAVLDTYNSTVERVEVEVRGGSTPLPVDQMHVAVRTSDSTTRYQTRLVS